MPKYTPAIYKIYFKQKPEILYIGSAVDFNLRMIRHKHHLKKGIHRNLHLQRSYNKYGKENMVFEILEKLNSPEFLIQREQFFIDSLNPQINILKIACSPLGYKHSEETKKYISKVNTGRKMTPEQIIKGVIARKGQRTSLGCKRTETMRKHLSDLKKKPIINIKTGQIVDSLNWVSEITGIKYQTLYAKLSGTHRNDTNWRFYA